MKRYTIPFALIVVLLAGTIVQAQTTPPNEEIQRKLAELQLNLAQVQQRGGAVGRGAAPVWLNGGTEYIAGGAWWTNPRVVARVGLTDDQKAKLERTFESRRSELESKTALLEKEESQLSKLLDAEPVDRNAAFTQIDRVILARAELERTNAAMTLEMREHLTRAQWAQVPRSSPAFVKIVPRIDGVPVEGGARGGGAAGGAGGRGQRRGPPM